MSSGLLTLLNNISSEAVWTNFHLKHPSAGEFKVCAFYENGHQLLQWPKVAIGLAMGKIEKMAFIVRSHCRYFDKTFTEMFLEWSSIKQMIFLPSAHFNWLPLQPKCRKYKKISLKIISPETIWNIGLILCRNILCIIFYKFCVFYCYCSKALVAMVT